MDQKNKPDDGAMTVGEAWRRVGQNKISRGGFYAAISRNEVPHLRLGKRILIPKVAFEKWLAGVAA